jgi:membrane associated rhomboid family serine protease
VILAFVSAVFTPVSCFMNGRVLSPIQHTSSYREKPLSPVNEKERAKVFRVVDIGVRLHHSKRQHHFFQSRPPTATITSKFEGRQQRHDSSTSSQLFSSSSPIESSPRGKTTTAVYLLILASILAFVGDNMMHFQGFQAMYLYHRNWRWWQPITSTFCHGDKAHLSGNVFLLLLFGRSVEDELGPVGLLFSYIFCGMMANFVSLAMLPKNTVSLGASGAVFGLFSVSIFSRLSWGDVLDWRKIIEVGVLGQFVVDKFLTEARTAAAGGVAGVNHVAHLSGAAAGVAMVLILRKLINAMEK